jgi:ankyrin repeat protein
MLVEMALLSLLAGCHARPNLDHIILSYSESNTFCSDCPSFRVDFRNGGHVNYECLGSCAVPGEQHHVVPEQPFLELVRAFHDAGFFGIPRTDPSRIVQDATIFRLTYRDDRRIHEIIDDARNLPRVTDLERRFKAATEVNRYLKPSVAFYRQLVNSGWDVNTLGPDHQNALRSAVTSGDLDSTRFLLQHGSKVTDQTLNRAAWSQNLEILRLVVQTSQVKLTGERGAEMLEQASRSPKTDLVQYLLDSGADVNSRDSEKGTPLLSAMGSGSLESAKLLLSAGADPNARDSNGRSALWYAATADNTGFITSLLEHGANVNARDNEGRTALMHAADMCYTWDIRALLDAGADPTVQDNRGKTVLEPQLVSVGDPKCEVARKMFEDAMRSRAARSR